MSKEDIIKKFNEKPYLMDMGAGKLSKIFKTTPDVIKSVKLIIRNTNPQRVVVPNKLKVLFFDCETAPLRAFVWSRWKQNVGISQMISDWFMLSWSAKWGGDSKIMHSVLTPDESLSENDSRICNELWPILNEADVVVAHNGIRFDFKRINTRFLLNNLLPTRPFRVIDTLKVVQDTFAFSSNKLDNLLIQFGLDRKLDTDFGLWKDAVGGNVNALKYMSKYNDVDVIQLEAAFNKLKPWIKNFPHYGLYNYSEVDVCPMCGGQHTLIQDGYYTTSISKYKLYRCTLCHSISRDRVRENIKLNTVNNLR